MATITKSIGTTARDYSTITLWEAALGGAAGGAGNDAVGECYDDSAFDEAVVINDGTPDSVTLTAASGERHDGTAGNGVRIVRTAQDDVINCAASTPVTVTWIDIQGYGTDNANTNLVNVVAAENVRVSQMLLHDVSGGSAKHGIWIDSLSANKEAQIHNNIIYDIVKSTGSGGADVSGISDNVGTLTDKLLYVLNNTIHNVTNNGGGSGDCEGIHIAVDGFEHHVQNNIVTDTGGDNSGAKVDFDATIADVTNVSNNLSSDASAPGANSLTSKSPANQFVSTVGGSEDLHLKTGADAIDAGTDLGTSPTGVEIDIDGRDRDAESDTWDIGADEFVPAPVTGNPWYYYAQQEAAA